MADFLKAYKRTCRNEGGFADLEGDSGGLTWKGIARNYHPHWPGWVIVDRHLKELGLDKVRNASRPHFNKAEIQKIDAVLFKDQELDALVPPFYKQGFWDISQLDRFDSQLLAENLFDASVNCGASMGPHLLQEALNNLKQYGLKVDGVLGNMSFGALHDATQNFGEAAIIKAYVDQREAYHKDIVRRDPSKKRFLNGWIARCEAMRKPA